MLILIKIYKQKKKKTNPTNSVKDKLLQFPLNHKNVHPFTHAFIHPVRVACGWLVGLATTNNLETKKKIDTNTKTLKHLNFNVYICL